MTDPIDKTVHTMAGIELAGYIAGLLSVVPENRWDQIMDRALVLIHRIEQEAKHDRRTH